MVAKNSMINRCFIKVKALVSFQNADKTITGNILEFVLSVRDSMPHEEGILRFVLDEKLREKWREIKKKLTQWITCGEQTPSSAFVLPSLSAQLTGGKHYSRALAALAYSGQLPLVLWQPNRTWVRFPFCGNLPASLRKLPNITLVS